MNQEIHVNNIINDNSILKGFFSLLPIPTKLESNFRKCSQETKKQVLMRLSW